MSQTLTLLLIAGNIVALIGGLAAFGRWFRNWFKHALLNTVSEPLQAMQTKVDTLSSEVTRAHDRIDKHLEAHSHA